MGPVSYTHLDVYKRQSLTDSLLVFLAGFSLTVTPGKVGEVLKSYLLRESYGQPIARTAPIVLAERLTDLIGLLLLMLIGVATWMRPEHHYLLGIGLSLCLMMLLFASWRSLVYGLLGWVERIPTLGPKLGPKLREFYDAAYVLLRPVPLLLATFTSVLSLSLIHIFARAAGIGVRSTGSFRRISSGSSAEACVTVKSAKK